MDKLSHVDDKGKASMVDISSKVPMLRVAKASGTIIMATDTVKQIKENAMKKGDVLTCAEIAGIQGAKETSRLIPLCHPINISNIQVKTFLKSDRVDVKSEVVCIDRTGIEMEALTAVNIALLTVYDMCKGIDKNMIMSDIKLDEKTKRDL